MHTVLLHVGDRFDLVLIYGGLLGILLLIVGARYISKRMKLYRQNRKDKRDALLRTEQDANNSVLMQHLLPE